MKDILTKLQASLKSDVDTCATLRDELKQLRDATQEISVKSKRELSCIASRKCQDKIQQSEDYLKKNNVRVQVSITFQPAIEIFHYLFKMSGLGRIEKRAEVLTVQKKRHQVITINNFEYCHLPFYNKFQNVTHMLTEHGIISSIKRTRCMSSHN